MPSPRYGPCTETSWTDTSITHVRFEYEKNNEFVLFCMSRGLCSWKSPTLIDLDSVRRCGIGRHWIVLRAEWQLDEQRNLVRPFCIRRCRDSGRNIRFDKIGIRRYGMRYLGDGRKILLDADWGFQMNGFIEKKFQPGWSVSSPKLRVF